MAKKGSQGELNLKMFADFQKLQAVSFQPTSSIANFIDAMYIYSQYCYMGRKGKSSLMFLFDNVHSRSTLAKSFNEDINKLLSEDASTLAALLGMSNEDTRQLANNYQYLGAIMSEELIGKSLQFQGALAWRRRRRSKRFPYQQLL